MENEDFLDWGKKISFISSCSALLSNPRNGLPIVLGEYDCYSNLVKRRIEYYEYSDFCKVKAILSLKEKYKLALVAFEKKIIPRLVNE